jgi:hypothetical protein
MHMSDDLYQKRLEALVEEQNRLRARNIAESKSAWVNEAVDAATAYNIPRDSLPEATASPFTRRSPLSRRRQVGDAVKAIDYAGFWVHLETDTAGIPRSPTLIEVNDAMTEWRIVGENTARVMERLPKNGVFIFIW